MVKPLPEYGADTHVRLLIGAEVVDDVGPRLQGVIILSTFERPSGGSTFERLSERLLFLDPLTKRLCARNVHAETIDSKRQGPESGPPTSTAEGVAVEHAVRSCGGR